MAVGPARMSLMEHLGELRDRIFSSLVVLLVAIIVFYFATPMMGQFLLLPIYDFLPKGEDGLANLVALDPFESFTTRFKLAFWMSLVGCSPFLAWQILGYFLPALKPKERRWFLPTVGIGALLFILGTVFCYFIVLHPAFGWLTGQAAGLGTLEPRMATYIDMIVKFEIGFGLAFELPLVVFYLVVFNILPYRKLRSAWRYVYVVLIVASAMITPDASPVTMLMLFAALVALYEVSLLLARIVLARKIRRQNAELGLDEEEAAEELAYEMEQAFGKKKKDEESDGFAAKQAKRVGGFFSKKEK